MPDLKPFLKQHKLLTAGVASAVSALIITAMPAHAEQLGLVCDLSRRVVTDQGGSAITSRARVYLSIDTTRRVWWASSITINPPTESSAAWPFMSGQALPLHSFDSEQIVLVNPGREWVPPAIDRRTGHYYASQRAAGGSGIHEGRCIRDTFRPQPEKVF